MALLTPLLLLLALFSSSATVARASTSTVPLAQSNILVALTEYDWTFFVRGSRYGLQQFGPVANYARNAHIIWRNRAYRLPVTVPWVICIGVGLILVPLGFASLLFGRYRASASGHPAGSA